MKTGIIARSLKELYFRTPIYSWRLNRIAFKEIETPIVDLWPGESEVGRAVIDGETAGVKVENGESLWDIKAIDHLSLESLHGFSWLRHLRAQGGEAARKTACQLVEGWLVRFSEWHPLVWRADILGERVSAWLGMHDFFCESANDEFRISVLTSIRRQTAHGLGDIDSVQSGVKRLRAIKGLIIVCLAFRSDLHRIEFLQKLLEKEVELQVNSDGGHISRSPSVHIEVLMALIDIRNVFRANGEGTSENLQEVIGKMTSMLRLWRHGDGKLALFHSTQENGKSLIESIIGQSESRRKTFYEAPITGFYKLSAGGSNVIVDSGIGDCNDIGEHASLAAFEFSVGKQRLFVNCGTSPGNPYIREALRASSAHSMLTIDGFDILDKKSEPFLRNEAVLLFHKKSAVKGELLLELSHDGYKRSHGLTHNRTLYLSASGDDLRGEEGLQYSGDPGFVPEAAIIRFHLHPRVRASLVQNGSSIILRPTAGGIWRFKTDANLNLSESLYLGTATRQKTEQIVVTKVLENIRETGNVIIKWAVCREDGPTSS
ncbi:MAG: hypothetical protein CMM58_11945 [Rhodospirillaceae bacterium]|nr:hypothetical protein [Rhodospirillaceae bacterium]